MSGNNGLHKNAAVNSFVLRSAPVKKTQHFTFANKTDWKQKLSTVQTALLRRAACARKYVVGLFISRGKRGARPKRHKTQTISIDIFVRSYDVWIAPGGNWIEALRRRSAPMHIFDVSWEMQTCSLLESPCSTCSLPQFWLRAHCFRGSPRRGGSALFSAEKMFSSRPSCCAICKRRVQLRPKVRTVFVFSGTSLPPNSKCDLGCLPSHRESWRRSSWNRPYSQCVSQSLRSSTDTVHLNWYLGRLCCLFWTHSIPAIMYL